MDKKTFVARLDGWLNLITGLGARGKDKRTAAETLWYRHDELFFEHLYASDGMAARIVDLLPEEALRKDWSYSSVEKEQSDGYVTRLKALDAKSKLREAWKLARQYGGSAIVYFSKGTTGMDEPMRDNEEVVALQVLNRFELQADPNSIDMNPLSPTFRQPTLYRLSLLQSGGTDLNMLVVHSSRLELFHGAKLPRRLYVENGYWHDSVLTRPFNVIRNYQTSHDSSAAILQDFNVGVFKMRNLAELVAAGKEDQIRERVELANYSKSVIRSLIIDESETYEEKSRTVTGMPELLKAAGTNLVAQTDIPHTKLLGESPDGSNATGNSTTTSWYDYVDSQRIEYLTPKLINLTRKLNPGTPKNLDITYESLWQMDDNEEADVRLKVAQTDAIYLDRGVVDPAEIAVSRFGGDKYSMETELDLTARPAADRRPASDPAQPDPKDPSSEAP